MKFLKLLLICSATISFSAFADGWKAQYKVSITNISKGVYFTPLLNATHSRKVRLFEVGSAASEGVARMAEGGALDVLMAELAAADKRSNAVATEGLLAPGQTAEATLTSHKHQKFSLAAMLLPTNDTFVALNSVNLPYYGSYTYYAKAYDAGSETNDELCANIPGPQCGGVPFSPEDSGEGYIYPSPGIHGEADLTASEYDWQGPVAKVVITRMF